MIQTEWLLKRYKEISGEEKMKIASELSHAVRKWRQIGEEDRLKKHAKRSARITSEDSISA